MCSGGGNCPPCCHPLLNKPSGTLGLLVSPWRMGHCSRSISSCWAVLGLHNSSAPSAWGQRECLMVYPKYTANFAVFNPNRQHHIYLNLQLTAEKGLPLLILEPNAVICFLKRVLSTTSLWWGHKTSGTKRNSPLLTKLTFNSIKKEAKP